VLYYSVVGSTLAFTVTSYDPGSVNAADVKNSRSRDSNRRPAIFNIGSMTLPGSYEVTAQELTVQQVTIQEVS